MKKIHLKLVTYHRHRCYHHALLLRAAVYPRTSARSGAKDDSSKSRLRGLEITKANIPLNAIFLTYRTCK